MGKSKELGEEGEQLASDYLKKKGFEILETNYRYKRSEIDIIASTTKLLVFVEVKTRTNTEFGMPEDFVDKKQADSIVAGAEQYIQEKNWHGNIRFDIISIIKKGNVQLKHIEDAFY